MNRIVSDERLQQILERGPIELRIGELEALVSTIKGLRRIIKDYTENGG